MKSVVYIVSFLVLLIGNSFVAQANINQNPGVVLLSDGGDDGDPIPGGRCRVEGHSQKFIKVSKVHNNPFI
ncbi:MAG: hypothetical protein COB35_12745 [Gammaproteobacteria bacterium]|nr:MAG: hypothetical protein COB35_12745 [Gammaproteobacteria bacterium]